MTNNLLEKLNRPGPKKILSLDGGGVRGILTLGILKSIEDKVRNEASNPDLLLGDYYDLIGGTSTGSIIACGLAIGKCVDEIIELYLSLGSKIFGDGQKMKILPRWYTTSRAFLTESYSSAKLEEFLSDIFKEITIGDEQNVKCGLALNSKRADTYSLWTIANHPDGIYYKANRTIKLADFCRASSAAPYYFKPKKMNLQKRNGDPFVASFIDGGVSLANNPAWQTFLVATEPSFGFKFQYGADNLHITSVGTGNGSKKEDADALTKLKAVSWASKIPDLFMTDANEMNEILMNALGKNVGPILKGDSQFGDFSGTHYITDKLFTFERHNVKLEHKFLCDLGFQDFYERISSLKEMDHFENMETLLEIGKAYGKKYI
jgi:uncharacterized protein